MSAVELHVPPDTKYVGLARLVVVTAARRSGMDEERVEDLRIAVSEATTNAIASHQHVGSEEPVVLSFGADDDEDSFTVAIQDAGPGFEPADPEELANRNWQDESGLGITLIRNLADEVEFIQGDGMRVHLQFAVALDANGVAAGGPVG